MDNFDDAFGESPSNGNGANINDEPDPAAEFLAREQDNFAGLEDEIPEVGGGPAAETEAINAEDDFVHVQSNGEILNGNDEIGNGDDNFLSQDRPSSPPDFGSSTVFSVPREEPEKIRIWREEQTRRLEVKDREEEETKEKLREAAKKELEDWYKNYDEQIVQTRNSNRNAEPEGVSEDLSPTDDGKDWERIANLCDFNPKASKQQKDISRMRSLILQLKQSPPPRLQSGLKNGF